MKTASVTSTFSFQDYCDNVAVGLGGALILCDGRLVSAGRYFAASFILL